MTKTGSMDAFVAGMCSNTLDQQCLLPTANGTTICPFRVQARRCRLPATALQHSSFRRSLAEPGEKSHATEQSGGPVISHTAVFACLATLVVTCRSSGTLNQLLGLYGHQCAVQLANNA